MISRVIIKTARLSTSLSGITNGRSFPINSLNQASSDDFDCGEVTSTAGCNLDWTAYRAAKNKSNSSDSVKGVCKSWPLNAYSAGLNDSTCSVMSGRTRPTIKSLQSILSTLSTILTKLSFIVWSTAFGKVGEVEIAEYHFNTKCFMMWEKRVDKDALSCGGADGKVVELDVEVPSQIDLVCITDQAAADVNINGATNLLRRLQRGSLLVPASSFSIVNLWLHPVKLKSSSTHPTVTPTMTIGVRTRTLTDNRGKMMTAKTIIKIWDRLNPVDIHQVASSQQDRPSQSWSRNYARGDDLIRSSCRSSVKRWINNFRFLEPQPSPHRIFYISISSVSRGSFKGLWVDLRQVQYRQEPSSKLANLRSRFNRSYLKVESSLWRRAPQADSDDWCLKVMDARLGGFAHVYKATSSSPIPAGSPFATTTHVLKRIAVPDKAGVEQVGKEVEVMVSIWRENL